MYFKLLFILIRHALLLASYVTGLSYLLHNGAKLSISYWETDNFVKQLKINRLKSFESKYMVNK